MKITCNEDGIVKWEEEPRKKYIIKEISYREEKDQLWVDILLMDVTPLNYIKINLLPKECTMKTRFAVVNEREKVEFEKKWQMPYGYNNCPKICFNQDEAIQWIRENLGPTEKKEYVVEKHKAGKIEVVWKILDGHKLAGEKDEEQEEHDFDEDF
jgi:hypothetical protein